MGKNKHEKEEVEEKEQVELDEDGDFSEGGPDNYVTKEEMRKELLNRISAVQGDQKIAMAALYQLYEKQEDLDEERDKEIDQIKHQYRVKAEDNLNKLRKIVGGHHIENSLLDKIDILTKEEKEKGGKGVTVPDYWPTVIKNSSFASLIDKAEFPAIDSITDVVISFTPTAKQLHIEIHFGENSIFTDNVLKTTLTENEDDKISQKYDSPHYKSHYVKPETGLLNIFGELPEEELDGLYEYWFNFYQQEMPLGLAFYFELREGTFNRGGSFGFDGFEDDEDDEDLGDEDEEDEEAEDKQTKQKGNKNKKRKLEKPDKPECKQQ